jgi:hypothetical protein
MNSLLLGFADIPSIRVLRGLPPFDRHAAEIPPARPHAEYDDTSVLQQLLMDDVYGTLKTFSSMAIRVRPRKRRGTDHWERKRCR